MLFRSQDPVLIRQTAGGLYMKIMVVAYRHVKSDRIIHFVGFCLESFQKKRLDTADTDPHGAVKAGLGLGNDQTGILQSPDMQGSGRDRDVQDIRDLLQGQCGVFQKI